MSCTSYARPEYGNAYASCGGHDRVAYASCDEDSNSVSSCSSSSSSDGWPEDPGSVVSSSKVEKARAVHGKWLKTLWTVIDRADPPAERKTRRAKRSLPPPPPPPRHPVKNILRPPTEYVYVIGMSGLPSKVAVYPKRA